MTQDFIQSVIDEAMTRKRHMDNRILAQINGRSYKPIRVIQWSRLERVPVRKNPLIKYSTGDLASELVRRRAITLHSVEF